MGRYGNAASVEEVAWIAGCSEGLVENYTHHCFTAIEALHDLFVQQLSPAEKEVERNGLMHKLAFVVLGERDGSCMMEQLSYSTKNLGSMVMHIIHGRVTMA